MIIKLLYCRLITIPIGYEVDGRVCIIDYQNNKRIFIRNQDEYSSAGPFTGAERHTTNY